MKKLFILGFCLLSGCQQIYTDEIVRIANQCGGVEKINRMWTDGNTTKAYCVDGRRAGEW